MENEKTKRDQQLSCWVTEEEKRLIEQEATADGRNVSNYIWRKLFS